MYLFLFYLFIYLFFFIFIYRSENPADVLVAMKSIVITCKNITEESDEYERLNENTFTDEEQDKLIEIKNNLSVALTNLMSVTKNHATNYPNVSSSFIESAASDLSVTIVSLVRTLKEHQNRLLNQGSSPLQQPINQGKLRILINKVFIIIIIIIITLIENSKQH